MIDEIHMKPFDWLSEYRERLDDEGRLVRDADHQGLTPARRLRLEAEDWGAAARIAAAMGLRHAGVFADPPDLAPPAQTSTLPDDEEPTITLRAVLEQQGDYLVLETQVPLALPELPSQTPWYPGLDRLERHAQDLVGVRFTDHPHPHRWTRHQAWREGRFPLRADFPLAGEDQRRTQADRDYPFEALTGDGVYQIPVGPVHAGIIEPGHFRFHAEGETVLQLEARLGYVHKGIERLAVGRDAVGLARLAGRISGDSTVAHTWAACQALERASGCEVPARALVLRGLLCERERVANHIGDIGAICNDVGMAFIHMQCARLREDWQRASQAHFGHRLLMDRIIPGGVAVDLDAAAVATLRAEHEAMRRAIAPIFAIVDELPSLADRLLTTGHLQTKDARTLGCTGYVAKASGLGFDLRRDAPYPPYDALAVEVPVQQEGDVAARVRMRMHEVRQSLNLMDELLRRLPDGPIAAELPAASAGAIGLGLVEGWRGEVLAFVRFRNDGRIARYFARDPSWFTWPALERLIHGNIVPDFPVCNKSVNASYSGQDL